jgi:hypothetical protein
MINELIREAYRDRAVQMVINEANSIIHNGKTENALTADENSDKISQNKEEQEKTDD